MGIDPGVPKVPPDVLEWEPGVFTYGLRRHKLQIGTNAGPQGVIFRSGINLQTVSQIRGEIFSIPHDRKN